MALMILRELYAYNVRFKTTTRRDHLALQNERGIGMQEEEKKNVTSSNVNFHCDVLFFRAIRPHFSTRRKKYKIIATKPHQASNFVFSLVLRNLREEEKKIER